MIESDFGDPISAMGFNAKAVMPSFKHRWNNSAHNHSGLFIKDAVPTHDVENNPLQTSWLNHLTNVNLGINLHPLRKVLRFANSKFYLTLIQTKYNYTYLLTISK